jgi:hypothetical protein
MPTTTCICGITVQATSIYRHRLSQKHIDALASKAKDDPAVQKQAEAEAEQLSQNRTRIQERKRLADEIEALCVASGYPPKPIPQKTTCILCKVRITDTRSARYKHKTTKRHRENVAALDE